MELGIGNYRIISNKEGMIQVYYMRGFIGSYNELSQILDSKQLEQSALNYLRLNCKLSLDIIKQIV